MSAWLIGIVTFIYLLVAIDLFRQGKGALAWSFFSYALANVGFIILAMRPEK